MRSSICSRWESGETATRGIAGRKVGVAVGGPGVEVAVGGARVDEAVGVAVGPMDCVKTASTQ